MVVLSASDGDESDSEAEWSVGKSAARAYDESGGCYSDDVGGYESVVGVA